MAKIFLHTLSISKKYNMISFLTLEVSAGEWRRWSVVTCHKGILWCRLELRLSKWQAIQAFHIRVELWQGCVLFLFFFIVYMNCIDKCNQIDKFAIIGN